MCRRPSEIPLKPTWENVPRVFKGYSRTTFSCVSAKFRRLPAGSAPMRLKGLP